MQGKFIVLYGANNLGKTTQVRYLKDNLEHRVGKENVLVLKYPIYDTPTGQRIDAELRRQRTMTDLELQIEFAANRRCFETDLNDLLRSGVWVVAEDYKGTGIAWGVANGISLQTMEEINRGLKDEDLAILMDGERFTGGIERGHRYEEGGKWEQARITHLELAARYGWEIVSANGTEANVAQNIWAVVENKFF